MKKVTSVVLTLALTVTMILGLASAATALDWDSEGKSWNWKQVDISMDDFDGATAVKFTGTAAEAGSSKIGFQIGYADGSNCQPGAMLEHPAGDFTVTMTDVATDDGAVSTSIKEIAKFFADTEGQWAQFYYMESSDISVKITGFEIVKGDSAPKDEAGKTGDAMNMIAIAGLAVVALAGAVVVANKKNA